MKQTLVNTATNATTYPLSHIAAALKTSNDGARKKLAAAGIKPVAEYKTANGRTFDFYDQNTMDTVKSWRVAADARKAAAAAKQAAKIERVKTRGLRAQARLTAAKFVPVTEPIPVANTEALEAKLNLLVSAVELLNRRVDSMISRVLSVTDYPVPFDVTCDVLGVKDDVHA